MAGYWAAGWANWRMWKNESMPPSAIPKFTHGHHSPTRPTLCESGIIPAQEEATV